MVLGQQLALEYTESSLHEFQWQISLKKVEVWLVLIIAGRDRAEGRTYQICLYPWLWIPCQYTERVHEIRRRFYYQTSVWLCRTRESIVWQSNVGLRQIFLVMVIRSNENSSVSSRRTESYKEAYIPILCNISRHFVRQRQKDGYRSHKIVEDALPLPWL